MGSVGSLTAGTPTAGGIPMYTPPQTPGYTAVSAATPVPNSLAPPAGALKRETEPIEEERGRPEKRRRIAPTLISESGNTGPSTSAPKAE